MEKLKKLPPEIRTHIYTYDDTFRQRFTHLVLPQMLCAVRDRIYMHLLSFPDGDYGGLYQYITQDYFPLCLFYNHKKFYQLDKKFFNHYFRKLMLTESQGFYLRYSYTF